MNKVLCGFLAEKSLGDSPPGPFNLDLVPDEGHHLQRAGGDIE